MNIITPITITDAMIGAGTTVAEDPTPAWVSGAAYTVGQEVHLASTHRVYRCAADTSGTLAPNTAITVWSDMRPTNRWAPFDQYTSTAATATTSLTYVLKPGFFNALALYGLVGVSYAVTVKDAPGGAVVYSRTGAFFEDPDGWYEYLFGILKPLDKLVLTGMPLRPDAELTVTITAASGAKVALGMLVVGDFKSLLGGAYWGGAERGSSAEPITYSYIRTEEDGTTTIRRRHSATNLRVQVVMPIQSADYALNAIREVLDVPVAVVSTTARHHTGLTTFGLVSGGVSYDGPLARANIIVKGLI